MMSVCNLDFCPFYFIETKLFVFLTETLIDLYFEYFSFNCCFVLRSIFYLNFVMYLGIFFT